MSNAEQADSEVRLEARISANQLNFIRSDSGDPDFWHSYQALFSRPKIGNLYNDDARRLLAC